MRNRVSRRNANSVKPAGGDGSLGADSLDDPRRSKEQDSPVDDFAVIDLNHPLAGHALTFDIELVDAVSNKG
jgi:hypothetical protein